MGFKKQVAKNRVDLVNKNSGCRLTERLDIRCRLYLEFHYFQKRHQHDLSKLHGFHVPTKEDFDHFDVDKDGIIMFGEWKSLEE